MIGPAADCPVLGWLVEIAVDDCADNAVHAAGTVGDEFSSVSEGMALVSGGCSGPALKQRLVAVRGDLWDRSLLEDIIVRHVVRLIELFEYVREECILVVESS